jgi:hypothetical protein
MRERIAWYDLRYVDRSVTADAQSNGSVPTSTRTRHWEKMWGDGPQLVGRSKKVSAGKKPSARKTLSCHLSAVAKNNKTRSGDERDPRAVAASEVDYGLAMTRAYVSRR